MDHATYLAHLRADNARLRVAAAHALDRPVPSCPGWTGADLLNHVAEVYLEKAQTMRLGAYPQPWPPDLTGKDPLTTFDEAAADVIAELEGRDPAAHSLTWYDPDQTVGFWGRRMAQEAVIHRIDAELAAGVESAVVPADLATDGIDEVLITFLSFASAAYPTGFGGALDTLDGRTVRVEAGASSWYVTLAPTITVAPSGTAAATLRGEPDTILRWLWRRTDDENVTVEGDKLLVSTLYDLLKSATQ
ncbi:maleylpyruvate isomerase family mycothiol-dependent enzyme [Actinokineospora terrae]|uniref:TIGR03083 family protein n=1 Tax=Actinokineospora terrae TaxID=155974 RepID=A0A1H9VW77_9PSEU|nr:maleylpyruvate isomerase family mycothiol-dependent enzyme [Actinokineospora terrae]SES25759.1 TIGR03083 family protein [Actinokineospora terrae]